MFLEFAIASSGEGSVHVLVCLSRLGARFAFPRLSAHLNMAGCRVPSQGPPLLSRFLHLKAPFARFSPGSPDLLQGELTTSSAASSPSSTSSSSFSCSFLLREDVGFSPRLRRQLPSPRSFPFSCPASCPVSPVFAARSFSRPFVSAGQTDKLTNEEILRRVEAAAARVRQDAEKKRRHASENAPQNHTPSPLRASVSPSSSLSSSSLPLVNLAKTGELLQKDGETLPSGPESTFVDVGYRVEKASHLAAALNQLQSTLLLLHACPREGGLKTEVCKITAKAYLDMAMLYHQCNKLDEAADAYQRALSFFSERVFQPENVSQNENDGTQTKREADGASVSPAFALDIANCLSCLGVVETDRQNAAKAVEYLQKAMLWKVSLVNNLPLAPLLKDLAEGSKLGAASSSRSTDEARAETPAMEIPLEPEGLFFDTMNSLGGIYLRQGKVQESAAVLRFAVECMYSLGELYTGQRFRHLGRKTETDDVQTRAEKGRKQCEEPLTLSTFFHGTGKVEASSQPSSPSPFVSSSEVEARDTFAFFLTAVCERINEERRLLREELRRAAEREGEKKRNLRRLQAQQVDSAAGVPPAERSEQDAGRPRNGETRGQDSENRNEGVECQSSEPQGVAHNPPRTKARSGAEGMLPYGTIVFYNLSQSLLALGQPAEAREALEKAEALAQLSKKPDLEGRVAALKASFSSSTCSSSGQ
uniref:Tetratricopeptide repeat-containing protein n=1 Tax=Neospora caninum (strain Liverpool) TaxID=572307 RepID=A0A0F7U935_NEOCL|nr:TPA: tetratricopeptide repeat-containing protein [Neospora caninum Liverpool]